MEKLSYLQAKIKRKINEIFIYSKHKTKFLFLNTTADQKKTNSNFINQRFKSFKQIILNFEGSYKTDLFPNWYKNEKKLKKVVGQITSGNPLIFNQTKVKNQKNFDWFSDPTLENSKPFDKKAFCWDLLNSWNKNLKYQEKSQTFPDIRAIWELSRLQFLQPVALAAEKNVLLKKLNLNNWIESTISDWICQNTYLTGPNWTCAMEVAIRAINILWAVSKINLGSPEFVKKLYLSLKQHFNFIQDSWEHFDRPNNHYLADLLGYAYLCVFFNENNKLAVTLSKLDEQLDLQILPDHTFYEGSTAYHNLVTEIALHHHFLKKTIRTPIYKSKSPTSLLEEVGFTNKIKAALGFSKVTSDLKIGDNDSSKILFGINPSKNKPEKASLKYFPDFGLAIWRDRTTSWSLRIPKKVNRQPTGHFHQDWLSLTLTLDEVNILVDPGTAQYTANIANRNLMRSFASHSTFYNQAWIQDLDGLNLFYLKDFPTKTTFCQKPFIKACHFFKNLDFERKIIPNEKEKYIEIHDSVRGECSSLIWNFVLSPKLIVKTTSKNEFLLKQGQKRFAFNCNIDLEKLKGPYSSDYSNIQDTIYLRSKPLVCNSDFLVKTNIKVL